MPAILVSQMYSRGTLRKVAGQYVATESWQVVGTSDKQQAMESAVSHGAVYALNPYMTCSHREASNNRGPLSWIVVATFTFGDPGTGADTGPLGEPARIIGRPTLVSVPSDVDINGNPIVNSAGDPFDPPDPDFIHGFELTVRKALPFYNVQQSIQYIGARNSDQFTLNGAGGVDVGQCLCTRYQPEQDYSSNPNTAHPYVWVEFGFEFRGGVDPFEYHPVDVGRNGFYVSGGKTLKGPICYADGTPVTTDIRLDGTGKPLDTTLKIANLTTGATFSPTANPSLPNGLQVDSSRSSTYQKTLTWKRKTAQPFAGLV